MIRSDHVHPTVQVTGGPKGSNYFCEKKSEFDMLILHKKSDKILMIFYIPEIS